MKLSVFKHIWRRSLPSCVVTPARWRSVEKVDSQSFLSSCARVTSCDDICSCSILTEGHKDDETMFATVVFTSCKASSFTFCKQLSAGTPVQECFTWRNDTSHKAIKSINFLLKSKVPILVVQLYNQCIWEHMEARPAPLRFSRPN